MSVFLTSASDYGYKPQKGVNFVWDTFRRGLNTLLRENEIGKDELAQADNILLIGKGVPTKRWGTALFNQAGNATGSVRGLKGYYTSNGTVELLSITDDGFLTKKSGASYSLIAGASWASGHNAYMTQLDDSIYIVNGQRELVRYSLPTLNGFATIGVPVIAGASNLSNATGSTIKSYRASAVSEVGETVASNPFELISQPVSLGGVNGGTIRVAITPPSTASGILAGINVYGRDSGSERFLGFLPGNATIFLDDGSSIPKEFTFPPTADSTGGPKAKYIKRFFDRLVFAGIDGEPSKVLISGRVPNQEKFDLSYGGNYINIEPDAGDNITQIEVYRDRIIVFKERSIWQITLTFEAIGNFFVTTPVLQLITASTGCIAPRSVVPVENDIYFLSRRGVNSLGYESGFAIDALRSNEISVKVRPFFKNLTVPQKVGATATYYDFKYIISFPGLDRTMVFDRERLAWIGPWTTDANMFETFYDENNAEHLLFGRDDSALVDEYSESLQSDKGSAIQTVLRTRQEDFGDWSQFKNIRNVFTQFRNITGEVSADITLEQRNGAVISAESFSVEPNTGASGWGADLWGSALWGGTNAEVGGVDSQQTIRWADLNKSARTVQLTVRTNGISSNFELLGIRGKATGISAGFLPSSWRT